VFQNGKSSVFICVCYYRLSRKTFDTAETYKEFGPIRIEFGKVKSNKSVYVYKITT